MALWPRGSDPAGTGSRPEGARTRFARGPRAAPRERAPPPSEGRDARAHSNRRRVAAAAVPDLSAAYGRLVETRHAVDLDVHALPVRSRADAGARDFLALKEIAERFVERGEVFGVPQHHSHVHDVREIQPRGGEDALQVREGLPRLLADIRAHYLPRLRIERPLARHEEQIPRADRLGERRGRALVGESRGGRALRGDDLLGHRPYSNAALISAGIGIAFRRFASSGLRCAHTRVSEPSTARTPRFSTAWPALEVFSFPFPTPGPMT